MASGVSLGASTMAENIKIENYQPALFNSRFSNQNQTRNCWQNWTSTAMRRQCLLKRVMPPCVNDIRVCTSPSTLYPGCQPGTIARQKERFLGRSELAPPHLFCPPPFSGQWRGTWGDPHPGILNHGLTKNKYSLEKWKKKKNSRFIHPSFSSFGRKKVEIFVRNRSKTQI